MSCIHYITGTKAESDIDTIDDLTGDWQVVRRSGDSSQVIETDLPEEVARQMVEDYAAEGETVWMERTAPAPE